MTAFSMQQTARRFQRHLACIRPPDWAKVFDTPHHTWYEAPSMHAVIRPCVRSVAAILLCAVFAPVAHAADSLDRIGTQWAPFLEWTVKNPGQSGNPFDVIATATFTHAKSGERRTTGMFYDGGDRWKFRFTGTRPGTWKFVTSSKARNLNGLKGTVTVKPNPRGYGFVVGVKNKWARQRGVEGKPEAFVPQFVMYSHPGTFYRKPKKIDADIRTFLEGHGFTGFHVPVFCRWFDIAKDRAADIKSRDPNPDPRTFEALELLIAKVHRAGGSVHLWMWGDQMRTQTPIKWGINGKADLRLQRYIAARLGPLPGWTAGYGFDLWEWVKGPQLARWHQHLHSQFGWPHLLGARSQKNKLSQICESLDYASYEQHRPDFATYLATIRKHPGKPAFSEDRFRIRQSKRYRDKDYDEQRTRRGLWHSALAGGVANIWGNLQGDLQINMGKGASRPYPHPQFIKTNAEFLRGRFLLDMSPDERISNGVCLRRPDSSSLLFYREDCTAIRLDLSKLRGPASAVAVDTKKKYAEIALGKLAAKNQTWKAPYKSDWAIAVGEFPNRRR